MASSSAAPGLPDTKKAWERMREKFPEDNEKAAKKPNPASKIEIEEFLTLRVLWRVYQRKQLGAYLKKQGITEQMLNETKIRLENTKQWTAYLKCVQNNLKLDCHCNPPCKSSSDHSDTIGRFVSALKHQKKLLDNPNIKGKYEDRYSFRIRQNVPSYTDPDIASASPSTPESKMTRDGMRGNDPSTPIGPMTQQFNNLNISPQIPQTPQTPLRDAKFLGPAMFPKNTDEANVNSALIEFLAAITGCLPLCQAYWNPNKMSFSIDNFTAKVDGYLEQEDTEQIKAIIEVKAARRNKDDVISRVRMQEGAQMAAWIFTDKKDEGCYSHGKDRSGRILISQCCDEICLTFADYGAQYIKNWQQSDRNDNFLGMNEFGPYKIDHPGQMSELGPIVVALAIQMCGEKASDS